MNLILTNTRITSKMEEKETQMNEFKAVTKKYEDGKNEIRKLDIISTI